MAMSQERQIALSRTSMEGKRVEYVSPSSSSSPPTPPSPLPVSIGPGNQKYLFSPSPSSSPPFSPSPSTHPSSEKLPLLQENLSHSAAAVAHSPSAFSVDRKDPDGLEPESSCLKDLLLWLLQKCCNCCVQHSLKGDTDLEFLIRKKY
ncbi:pectinesterase inhibitor 10-like [Tripterygium wilfordii]|uniref:pectinesterase inhibitor 10-like n=1 Tax=Tripterygium wilfordii TaxID=458696 RepID=UPI0018F84E04|nr:pectinesterase inhibitor 10-like [Tripterygium wilfordii]